MRLTWTTKERQVKKVMKPVNKWICFLSIAIIASFAAIIVGTPYFGVLAGSGGEAAVQTVITAEPSVASPRDLKEDAEAVQILRTAISNGDFEVMSSAKQMQLQLQAGMTYEDGVLREGNPVERVESEVVLGLDSISRAESNLGGFA